MLPLPSESGPGVGDYLFGTGDGTVPMDIGLAPTKLQPGVYGLADSSMRRDPSELALAWALGGLEVTHVSLFDGSVQGIHRKDKAAFSFQGHPEASPGPHDAAPLFDHFIELMTARQEG